MATNATGTNTGTVTTTFTVPGPFNETHARDIGTFLKALKTNKVPADLIPDLVREYHHQALRAHFR